MNTTKLKDGGPAFPIPITSDPKGCVYHACEVIPGGGGMTLRQYFAARASEQVPDWFKAKLTPLPDRPADAEFCQGCQADGDCLKTEPCKRATEWTARKIEVGMMNKAERFFQWRAYYADMMIATLEQASPIIPTMLGIGDAIKIAKGCFDYSGGHRDEAMETFHHGIQTVVNALEAASVKGLNDSQIAVLHSIGSK